ncbi:hypothetical protein Cgig2_017322 [Carnegiea gigantea]|uniref:non-specific serine/threonine protein kinase n=1 Tax=Carnegiea gigantea TaxID=171969 RepID=A0A9Q1K594_9CARY|nr:hypothetical protein Cgig2_017322 [Carnegiea gigantea]
MSKRSLGVGVKSRTRVGKYELGKTLGEGNFAKVKFATNVDTGDAVAIKILNRDHVLRHKMVEQIKREISTMKVIKHPNVVKLYEVMASKTKIYMVLELVDAGELFDKIAKRGRLKENEARKYFQQLINAVDYCHSRGVYHRDLKEDGLLHTACGTPNYVAPEVLTDKGYDGTAADVWSCGIILFVLMAGYLPFDDPNLMNLYKKIQGANFVVPLWFSSGAKKLIKRILDPNPLTRITISEILQDEWFKKDYHPPSFADEADVNLDDVDAAFCDSEEHLVTERREKPASMNAFELISGSQGFSLESLFNKEPGIVKRETRFTSRCPANDIISKIEEAAKSLDFNVHKRNYKIKLQGHASGRKGRLSVATEWPDVNNTPLGFKDVVRLLDRPFPQRSFSPKVFEVAPSLHVVELRKTGGDTLEFHNFYKSFSSGLKDVVWKCDLVDEGHDDQKAPNESVSPVPWFRTCFLL